MNKFRPLVSLGIGIIPLFSAAQTTTQLPSKPTKASLVLSGGGPLGWRYLPVLDELEKHHVILDSIGGTSASALVSAFYFQGLSTDDIRKLIRYVSNGEYTSDWVNSNASELKPSDVLMKQHWNKFLGDRVKYELTPMRQKEDLRRYENATILGRAAFWLGTDLNNSTRMSLRLGKRF
jgi:predicted acylesterase/phospholipase RssA